MDADEGSVDFRIAGLRMRQIGLGENIRVRLRLRCRYLPGCRGK